MLYLVLKAWDFLAKKVSFLVEHAIKNNKNPIEISCLNVLVFNGKRFYQLTFKNTF